MNRSKIAIVREILHVCWEKSEGASKTRIVYQANLNFRSVNAYLEDLLATGAILNDNRKYKITEAGKALCQQIRALPVALGGLAA